MSEIAFKADVVYFISYRYIHPAGVSNTIHLFAI